MQAGMHQSMVAAGAQGLACMRLSQGPQSAREECRCCWSAGAVADLHEAIVCVHRAGILACVLLRAGAREADEPLPTLRKVLFSLSGPLTSATTSCSRAHSSVWWPILAAWMASAVPHAPAWSTSMHPSRDRACAWRSRQLETCTSKS